MRDSGRDFAEVLQEAQDLGYAEADPSFDVDGVDAAHKLAILAAVAFGREVNFEKVYIEGIRDVSPLDISFADELGPEHQTARHCPRRLPMASNSGSTLAWCPKKRRSPPLKVFSMPWSPTAISSTASWPKGRGAGGGPTASAVVADIVDVARGLQRACVRCARAVRTSLARPLAHGPARGLLLFAASGLGSSRGDCRHVAAALRDEDISVESMLQHGRGDE